MMLHLLAGGLALFWLSIVALGLLGARRGAALVAGMTGIMVTLPFLPRLMLYVYDRSGFVVRFGAAAVSEVVLGAVIVTLGVAALISAPLAMRYALGWLVPALATVFPVALVVWLAFWFEIRF